MAPRAARRPGFLGKPSLGDQTCQHLPLPKEPWHPGQLSNKCDKDASHLKCIHISSKLVSRASPHASQDRRRHHEQQLPACTYLPGLPARSQPYHPALPSMAQDCLEDRAGTTPREFLCLSFHRSTANLWLCEGRVDLWRRAANAWCSEQDSNREDSEAPR